MAKKTYRVHADHPIATADDQMHAPGSELKLDPKDPHDLRSIELGDLVEVPTQSRKQTPSAKSAEPQAGKEKTDA